MHTSPDTLALAALGEELPDEDQAHVASCPVCREELDELSRTVAVARTVGPEDVLQAPPPGVWAAVQAELGLATSAIAPSPAIASPVDHPVRASRSRRIASLALAAAVALVAGIGIGIGVDRLREPSRTVIGKAELSALPGVPGAEGEVTIYRYSDGTREMALDMRTSSPVQGRLQVWLADPDLKVMNPMGFVSGDRGRWTIPDTLNLTDFPVVDVSEEPAGDTDLQHSDTSILRGRLTG